MNITGKSKKIRKKILLISNMYPSKRDPDYGVFVKNTEELLLQEGYVVKRAVVHKARHKLTKAAAYLKCYVQAVLRGVFGNYDCIYAHYISHTVPPAAIIKRIKKHTVIVGNAHGEDVCPDKPCCQKNSRRTGKALGVTDYLIVPSGYFKTYVINEYQYPGNRIFVFPSGGVNEEKFRVLDSKTCRDFFRFSDRLCYIGFASRIVADKGWDTFLDAAAILANRKEYENLRFVMAGSGDEESLMNKRIRQLHLEKNIIRFPALSQEKLGVFFNAIDIFCFPTRRKSESLGLVGLEAMSCEAVCIISDTKGGQLGYVEDGVNALLFSGSSAEELAEKIIYVCKMSGEGKSKIRKMAGKTAQMYTGQTVKPILGRIFQKVTGENGEKDIDLSAWRK